MALASNEIRQQQALAMIHDLDNMIGRLSTMKMNLVNTSTDLLSLGSTLDPDSPEMKVIERRRQQLAAYEKKIDAEIQIYQNRRKKAEAILQNSTQKVKEAIERMYGGKG